MLEMRMSELMAALPMSQWGYLTNTHMCVQTYTAFTASWCCVLRIITGLPGNKSRKIDGPGPDKQSTQGVHLCVCVTVGVSLFWDNKKISYYHISFDLSHMYRHTHPTRMHVYMFLSNFIYSVWRHYVFFIF